MDGLVDTAGSGDMAAIATAAATTTDDAAAAVDSAAKAEPTPHAGIKRDAAEPPPVANEEDEALLCQIRIDRVPKYQTKKDVQQRLERHLGVKNIRRIKKQHHPAQDFCFVYFQDSASRFAGEALIEGHAWKGNVLTVKQAIPLAGDRFEKRQRIDGTGGGDGGDTNGGAQPRGGDAGTSSGGPVPAAEERPLRSAADVVTSLHALPYEEQLERKKAGLESALRKLPAEMKRASKGIPGDQLGPWHRIPWLHPSRVKANGGNPCPLTAVIPARLIDGYRNKCEFSFGRDANGTPCLGFQLGQIRLIGAVVGRPDECKNVSPAMKAVVARVQSFVETSALPPYDKMTNGGYWRQLNVRQAFNPPPAESDGDGGRGGGDGGGATATPMLLLFLVKESEASAATAKEEHARLVAALTQTPFSPPIDLRIAFSTSEGHGEATSAEASEQWLVGPPYVEERLLGLTYRVSPAAFFQVNTPGAEQLCELLRDLCHVGPSTVLLDVCCGTGTIGLSLASAVKRVVGIEICVPAVDDARANAARNGVANATFIAQKAEQATHKVLESLTEEEKASLVAIVDPPRAGLHHDVLKALRACLPLKKLIFVSCHSPAFVGNAVPLCRPTSKSFQGEPFCPTASYALDLFPHTPHCELIVVLERGLPADYWRTPSGGAAAAAAAAASSDATGGDGSSAIEEKEGEAAPAEE